MFLWIIQMIIISIIIIFIIHNLVFFFKSTLTVPKIKDLVNSPQQKYETMFNIISNEKYKNNKNNKNNENIIIEEECENINDSTTNISSIIPTNDYIQTLIPNNLNNSIKSTMKSELKMFLKNKLRS